eukprot:gb/GECH01011583.1/.p1 GENE.gb/GECH01011583.1/~~gb/GECH01011583.1/.p1  ORF type:complete len:204 (+),score=40.14 gb/GECH01011583.1/:1-612(+)
MPSSRTMRLNKRDLEALIQSLRKLKSISSEMERGIKTCETAWNTVLLETDDMPVACPSVMMDLCAEYTPEQAQLADQLLDIISVENKFLNILEDAQQIIEETTGISAAATVSRRHNFKSKINNQPGFFQPEQNKDPLSSLCFKEHFNRACEGSKLLFNVRKLFYKAEEDNDALDQFHQEFKNLVPEFQEQTKAIEKTLQHVKS